MDIDQIHTAHADIQNTTLTKVAAAPLQPGEARLEIEGFALTANNVTYAATGPVIGYWKFYPTEDPALGMVPVWGIARVTESRSDVLEIGDRIYGFLPMASHLTLRPEARGKAALRDITPHRVDLPPVYNTYMRCMDDTVKSDAERAIFHPLLATSYLLFDFLEDNDWFGAEQVIIGSASSKTGLGLAHYLAENKVANRRIIGLTSPGNVDFVKGLGTCDQTITYDAIEAELAKAPSVYVDMAGNADVRGRLHHHLGDDMKHSAAVGTSHWDKFEPTGDLPGARPRFFFAPAQIEKRRQEWGPGEIEKRIDAAWRRVASTSDAWMDIKIHQGLAAAEETYQALSNGTVPGNEGHYITL